MEPPSTSRTAPKLLDQARAVLRRKHYSLRTEEQYVGWIRRFIRHHGKRHPRTMGEPEMTAFLTHLAVAGQVAASKQNQAFSALLFLYREVLEMELGAIASIQRAQQPRKLPVVLTRGEMERLLPHLEGAKWLMGNLLYGSGRRLLECLRLRVKDVDSGICGSRCGMGKGRRIERRCCR